MSKYEILINKNPFEKQFILKNGNKEMEICRVSQYSDCLEIYSNYKGNNVSSAVLLEIDFLLNRDVTLNSHLVAGNIDTLKFKNFTDLKDFTIGETPAKIRRLFKDSTSKYQEAYSTCISKKRKIYFSIRIIDDIEKDEDGFEKHDDYCLIGAYLYDPKSLNDEVYSPLQAIYATKIKIDLK